MGAAHKTIRVAVSGTHGVGKTTFCGDLGETLKSFDARSHTIQVVTNVSRGLHAAGIVAVNKATEESQYPIFLEKHVSNIFREWGVDFVIYDRTIVDTISYGTVNGNLHRNWISFVRTAMPHLLRPIDVYFYIPIEFEIEDDGLRSTEIKYQKDVDRAVVEILSACRPDAITLRGSREARVAQAIKDIRKHL